jgi:hypothetical protein
MQGSMGWSDVFEQVEQILLGVYVPSNALEKAAQKIAGGVGRHDAPAEEQIIQGLLDFHGRLIIEFVLLSKPFRCHSQTSMVRRQKEWHQDTIFDRMSRPQLFDHTAGQHLALRSRDVVGQPIGNAFKQIADVQQPRIAISQTVQVDFPVRRHLLVLQERLAMTAGQANDIALDQGCASLRGRSSS